MAEYGVEKEPKPQPTIASDLFCAHVSLTRHNHAM